MRTNHMIKLKNLLLEIDSEYGNSMVAGFPAPAPISIPSDIKNIIDQVIIPRATSYKDGVRNITKSGELPVSEAWQNPLYILFAAALQGNAGGFWSKLLNRKARGNDAVITKIIDKMPTEQLYFSVDDTMNIPTPMKPATTPKGYFELSGPKDKPNIKFWSAPIIAAGFSAEKGGSTVDDGYNSSLPENKYFTGNFSELIKYVNNYNIGQVWSNKWNKGIRQLILTTEMTDYNSYENHNFVAIESEISSNLILYTMKGNQYNKIMMDNSLNALFLTQNVRTTGDSEQTSYGGKSGTGKTKDYKKAVSGV